MSTRLGIESTMRGADHLIPSWRGEASLGWRCSFIPIAGRQWEWNGGIDASGVVLVVLGVCGVGTGLQVAMMAG